jgi:mono/diheme cytochrome c family protein
MNGWGRRLAKLVAALALLVAVALGVLYLLTEPNVHDRAPRAFAALPKGDPVEGRRLAAIVGCTGCHGHDLGGEPFIHIPNVVALVAPDLSRARRKYDDAGLLRVLRSGVKRDGSYALGMPGFMQQRLSDREAADIIAFVRSVPEATKPVQGATAVYPLGRLGVLLGKYRPYEGDPPESAVVLRDRAEAKRGRHLVQIACTECHGDRLQGSEDIGAPALAIARAYSLAQFQALMRRGVTLAGTKSRTGLMSEVAVDRFSHMSDAEIADVHAWLTGSDRPR